MILAALIVVLFAGGLFMPETVASDMRTGFRMARPGVPRETLTAFVVATLGVTAAWSIVGLYLALVPALAPALMDTQSYLAAGAAIFALGGAAAASPLIAQRRTAPTQIVSGMLALTAGIGLMAVSMSTSSAPLFVAASLVIGAGVGLGMLGALRVLGAAAPPNHRARVMAAWYIVAYAAISVPAIAAGYTVRAAGAVHTFWIFGAGIVVVSLGTLLLVLARQGSADRHPSTPTTSAVASKAAN
jgi:hypothetical protein